MQLMSLPILPFTIETTQHQCTAEPFFLHALDQFLLESPEVEGEVFELADLTPN